MSLFGLAPEWAREQCLLWFVGLCVGCSDASTFPPPPTRTATETGVMTSTSIFTGTGTGTGTSTGTGTETGVELPTQLLSGKVAHAERAAPILGGTLLVTRDGATAVVADPDRDRVFFVDLHSLAVSELLLDQGDEPGRVLEGPSGRVFVLTRRTGALVAIDVAPRSVAFRVQLCRSPRGLDYDAQQGRVFVACRSGLVLTLAAETGETLASAQFDDDLRDILVNGSELVLTRAKSAEVLVVSESGAVLRRGAPFSGAGLNLFRSLRLPSGEILLAHQLAQSVDVGLVYAQPSGVCSPSLVTPTLSLTTTEPSSSPLPPLTNDPRDQTDPTLMGFNSILLGGLLGPVDIALAPEAGKFALLSIGNTWNLTGPGPTLVVGPLDAKTGSLSTGLTSALFGCAGAIAKSVSGEPIAVALDVRGRVYVQSREPAALVLDNGVMVRLSDVSQADTGLELFYMNAGGNIACASCHPEGLEDGLTWSGAALDPRRTQSLAGGLRARKPYHWGGELPTFTDLINEVLRRRMGALRAPTPEQIDTLSDWLDKIPAPQLAETLDAAAVERGRALFFADDPGCSQCHAGPDFSDHELHDVGLSGTMRTPSLLGVAARAPYFHDGCAETLLRIFGVCGGKGHGHDLPADAKADLVEFLRSL